MREETFFEHCLRRLEAGDTIESLGELLAEAGKVFEEGPPITRTEAKSRKKIDFALRAKKSWETRRKNAEAIEIQAKKDAFPQ